MVRMIDRASLAWMPMSTAPRDRLVTLRLSDGAEVRASVECLEGGDEDGSGWVFSWALAEDQEELPDWEDGWCWEHSRQPEAWRP